MATVSTTWKSRGYCFRSAGWAPVAPATMLPAESQLKIP